MRRALTLVLGVAIVAPAVAQSDARSASARAGDDDIRLGNAVAPEHAAGDWGGRRTRWVEAGIDLQAGYLAEVADVARGGLSRGADYAHQFKLQADVDGLRLLGVDGLGLHAALINREGRSASADRLGDDLFQVQEIYGAVDHAALHLSYLYAQYTAGQGAFDTKAGRVSVGQDFAASPLYCQFLALGLCPQPRALSLEPAFTVVPSATWGARVRAASQDLFLSLGAYQARPRYGGPSGFDWGFSHTTGAMVPLEGGWQPRFGASALQGHYKAGLAVDTSDAARVDAPAIHERSRLSWWALADQMVRRSGPGGTDGLILMAGWSHSDARTAALSDFGFLGVADRGIVAGRPRDVFNVLVGHGRVSGRLTSAQRAAAAAGQPLPTGFAALPGAFGPAAVAPGVQTRHDFVELNYGVKLRTGITLTPDVQYLWRPAASRSVPDALVLGVRFESNF